MKAKTKFLKIYDKLPVDAHSELFFFYGDKPMSLLVAYIEIIGNTAMGNKILKDLGFEDD